MITNNLLIIKYETQKRLNDEAKGDLRKYFENTQKDVAEIEVKYGIKFKYSKT